MVSSLKPSYQWVFIFLWLSISFQAHANIDSFLASNSSYRQVFCSNQNDCSPSVAKIVFLEQKSKPKLCTGSLIQLDENPNSKFLLTNSHCIPSELKQQKGSDCSQLLKVIFPSAEGYPYEMVSCNKVVIASELDRKKIREKHKSKFNFNLSPDILEMDPLILHDYAIIELESSPNRPALKINPYGIKDGEVVNITKSNPVSNGLTEMKSIQCRSTYDSYLSPVIDPNGYYYALTDCPILKGNSGSPVLNQQGEIVGLVYSYQKPNRQKGLLYDVGKTPNTSAVINSLKCIPYDTFNEDSLPDECFNYLTQTRLAYSRSSLSYTAQKVFSEKIYSDLETRITTYNSENGIVGLFKNLISTKDSQENNYFLDYGVQIICVHDNAKDSFSMKTQLFRAHLYLNTNFLIEYKMEQVNSDVSYKKIGEDESFVYYLIKTKFNKWQAPIPRCNQMTNNT